MFSAGRSMPLTVLPEFAVNGAAIPAVHFDIGESYAGLLPISDRLNETSRLYFWFVPSENPKASDEILIWLNGGVSDYDDQPSHVSDGLLARLLIS